jgi:hypothetical protein
MPNGVAQLQALLQNVLTRAEAQRPGITTRPISWIPPSSPGNEHFPPALYVRASGEYAVRGGRSHTVAVPGRARCQGNAGKEAEPAPSPHWDPTA